MCRVHQGQGRGEAVVAQRMRNRITNQRYNSEWRPVRALHLQIEPACRRCGSPERLEVHHILPVSTHPHLRLEQSNLCTLCHGCHLKERGARATPPERVPIPHHTAGEGLQAALSPGPTNPRL